jgi:hypothetical protein
MIYKDRIPDLIDLLLTRNVCLYHACQLIDFKAYLELGGIPSRKVLEDSGHVYTCFATDETDKSNNVWDKVFINLSDFGEFFSRGRGATPNPFGPILLLLNPKALLEADDVAVTLRSAGSQDYNRDIEALNTIEEINHLFKYSIGSYFPESSEIKNTNALKKDFNYEKAQNPELNITHPNQILSFQFLIVVLVDHYKFSGVQLLEIVKDLLYKKNHVRIEKRNCQSKERQRLYQEIAELLYEEIPSFKNLLNKNDVSVELKKWVRQLQKPDLPDEDLEWQFQRYAKYLQEGTISPAARIINC